MNAQKWRAQSFGNNCRNPYFGKTCKKYDLLQFLKNFVIWFHLKKSEMQVQIILGFLLKREFRTFKLQYLMNEVRHEAEFCVWSAICRNDKFSQSF